MRPCPALWLPEFVVEPIEMLAIQKHLQARHREDRLRKEERNQDFEVEADFNPTALTEERIDVEESPSPYTCHPSMDKWCEKPQPPPKAKPKGTIDFLIPSCLWKREKDHKIQRHQPKNCPLPKRKRNPIPMPGTSKEKGISTDFSPEEFASFQTGSNPGV
ncbi:hypothetical protein DSO57_1005949 [Entomophthora muscae]|uniref:Uncharacterized protein n=1 Tax=Entomophthora muscae TaxID=34485 RepID=A0ACC2TV11_9FUNG|nr:hypothetical protein DSO57_1005949 [Entomophthora muscae]